MKRYKKLKTALCLGLIACMTLTTKDTAQATRSVSTIQKEQKALQKEIDALDSELYDLVLEVEELSVQIDETQVEIEETEANLQSAQEACAEQYESMKVRIQYMYEAEDASVFEMLLEAGSISEFLNKLEYVNSVYDYDREKMDQYEAIQAEIKDLKEALDEEMAGLEADKASLVQKEASLDAMITEKKGTMKDLDAELKKAKEIAAREAAARAAAAAAKLKVAANTSYNVNGDLNPAKTTSIDGSSVVAFANQYVGYPYVWGGTSLTGGCDCSGFVMSVYANFGISWGTRMTSASFRSVGNEVSYNHMQAGDIICYSGHVAIYQGNGKIVEAQSTATGITNNRAAACKPIICIRRVI